MLTTPQASNKSPDSLPFLSLSHPDIYLGSCVRDRTKSGPWSVSFFFFLPYFFTACRRRRRRNTMHGSFFLVLPPYVCSIAAARRPRPRHDKGGLERRRKRQRRFPTFRGKNRNHRKILWNLKIPHFYYTSFFGNYFLPEIGESRVMGVGCISERQHLWRSLRRRGCDRSRGRLALSFCFLADIWWFITITNQASLSLSLSLAPHVFLSRRLELDALARVPDNNGTKKYPKNGSRPVSIEYS